MDINSLTLTKALYDTSSINNTLNLMNNDILNILNNHSLGNQCLWVYTNELVKTVLNRLKIHFLSISKVRDLVK